jgi:hypothetical protein
VSSEEINSAIKLTRDMVELEALIIKLRQKAIEIRTLHKVSQAQDNRLKALVDFLYADEISGGIFTGSNGSYWRLDYLLNHPNIKQLL